MSNNYPEKSHLEGELRKHENTLKEVENKIRHEEYEIAHKEDELKRHQAALNVLKVEESKAKAGIETIKHQMEEAEKRFEALEKAKH